MICGLKLSVLLIFDRLHANTWEDVQIMFMIAQRRRGLLGFDFHLPFFRVLYPSGAEISRT